MKKLFAGNMNTTMRFMAFDSEDMDVSRFEWFLDPQPARAILFDEPLRILQDLHIIVEVFRQSHVPKILGHHPADTPAVRTGEVST